MVLRNEWLASEYLCQDFASSQHYTPQDVADAFSEALDMTVEVAAIPGEEWEETFMQFGISNAAAQSYACMTETVVDGEAEKPDDPKRGPTTLRDYIRNIVRAAK